MSKKLYLLMSFVLVAGLAGNALALDLTIPDFADYYGGGPNTAAVLWEFEDGNEATSETNDTPTRILYNYPEDLDANFGFRLYGSDYDGATDPNYSFIWSTDGTVLVKEEESVMQPIPAGEGSNLTVQVQVMWQGPNCPMGDGPGIGLELWGGYPNKAPAPGELREGEWMDGIFNEECTIYLPPTAEVIAESVWRHTTYDYTFENFDPAVTHFAVIFFGFDQGSAGMLIDEVVIDMVVHDGASPPSGAGRPKLTYYRPGQARDPDPGNNEEHVVVDTKLAWSPDPCLAGPLSYDVYFGTDSNMANNPKIYDGTSANNVDPCAGNLAYGTAYYWRVDTNDANGAGNPVLYTGMNWKFTTLGLADDESPADGAKNVKPSVILSWVEDDYADLRHIYFGTDEAAVTNATTSTAGIYRGTDAPLDPCDPNRNTYDPPELLDLLKPAFWRIDESNSVHGAVKGDVWSFTTSRYFVVEDLEPYINDTALRAVWKDWYTDPDNGAEVFVERNPLLVNHGELSMRYYYRNFEHKGPTYYGSWAEAATADLQAGTDWTAAGVKALVLYFLGDPCNGKDTTGLDQDQMYVELVSGSNSGLIEYPDMNAVTEGFWHEWNIELQDFNDAGVTLSSLDKVYIGFGGTAKTGQTDPGAGMTYTIGDNVYFDDIQLHPPRCVPSYARGFGDVAEDDCIINRIDVALMSEDWLTHDYKVDPVPPPDANKLVEYLFDTDFSDTSGNNYHGVPSAAYTPTVSAGVMSVTDGGYVDVEGDFNSLDQFSGSKDFSIFITYRSDTETGTAAGPEQGGMVLITSVDPCCPTDWEDPNFDALAFLYSPMMVYVQQAHAGGPSNPDDFMSALDFWYVGGTFAYNTGVPGGIGQWHSVAVTYDADGGTCPSDADPNFCPPGSTTGLHVAYFDGMPTDEKSNFDPNIPEDSIKDYVRICTSQNTLHQEDLGVGNFVGDIDEVRVYNIPLSHPEVLYLSGIADPTYFANKSPANLVLKDPPGPPFDPDNLDIVNFKDYKVLAENWLDEKLWPPQP